MISSSSFMTWDNTNVPLVDIGEKAHPFYLTYTDFQKPYNYWTPQNNANNISTSHTITQGEFPANFNYRYAAGFNPNDRYLSFFSNDNINFISKSITQALHGVHPEGKNIIVPTSTIQSVADSVYQNTFQDQKVMTQMVVNYIVDAIQTEYNNTEKNNAYSPWVQRYDQSTGLSQFNDVKLNKKMRSPYMQWKY